MTEIVLGTVASVIILVRTLVVLNEMGESTRPPIRLAYILMSLGAFLVLVEPVFNPALDPGWPQTILHVGFAVLVLGNRRRTPPEARASKPHAADTGDDHTVYVRGRGN